MVERGDPEKMSAFLNLVNKQGMNAIQNLSYNDNNEYSTYGENLLQYVILRSHPATFREMVDVLLQHGIEVNHQDKRGNTPLHTLLTTRNLQNINTDVLRLLLDAGADINLQNNAGRTPLAQLLSLVYRPTEADKRVLEMIVQIFIDHEWNPFLNQGAGQKWRPFMNANRYNVVKGVESKGLTRIASMLKNYQASRNWSGSNKKGGRRTRRNKKTRQNKKTEKSRRH